MHSWLRKTCHFTGNGYTVCTMLSGAAPNSHPDTRKYKHLLFKLQNKNVYTACTKNNIFAKYTHNFTAIF